jgi:hypothetical protein
MSFDTASAPTVGAFSGVRFWLQPITRMPKAFPIRATGPPILPSPKSPSVRPPNSRPKVCCPPPERTAFTSSTKWRRLARISVRVISIRAARAYEPGVWAPRVSPTPLLMVVTLPDTIAVTDVALSVNPHVAKNGQSPLATRNDISKSASSKDFLDD